MKPVFLFSLSLTLLAAAAHGQAVEKAIPIEKNEPPQVALVAFRQQGVSVTVDQATASSQQNGNSVTNSLQQQMRLAVEQALSPWLTLAYGAGVGFRTQEIQLLHEEDQTSAYLTMLNRPALSWKPRADANIELAYEGQQNLSNELTTEQSGTASLQGKIKVNPQTTLGAGYTDQRRTAANGDKTSLSAARITSEYALASIPVTLQLNPGYENANAPDGTQAMRAFVENAVIWKVDGNTTLTVGSGFAGGRNTAFSESGYFQMQHVILPGTAFELRAAMLNADRDLPGEGFAVSAGSTIALAQSLSAGLNIRYKIDENAPVNRAKDETFLSLSINGRF